METENAANDIGDIGRFQQDIDCLLPTIVRSRKVVTLYDTFILFRIVTETNRPEFPGSHFEVERRFTDFEWLHSRLAHLNPALFIPPLPEKTLSTLVNRFSSRVISSRCEGLNRFLKQLSRHPVLSSSPDVVAFLTFLNNDFSKHREEHKAVGLTPEVAFIGACHHSGGAESLHPSSAEISLISSSVASRNKHEYRTFSDEANNLASIGKRLARSSEHIHGKLDAIRTHCDKLTYCLETWPPRLVAETVDHVIFDACHLQNTTRCSQISLGFSKERQSASLLVAAVTRNLSKETTQLANQLRSDTLPTWQDLACYASAVRNTLKSRDELEMRYLEAATRLGDESSGDIEAPERKHDTQHRSNLMKIFSDANKLQDQLLFFNSQIGAEFCRWRTERRQDVIQNLLRMAKAYTAYWSRIAYSWKDTLKNLETAASVIDGNKTTASSVAADYEATE